MVMCIAYGSWTVLMLVQFVKYILCVFDLNSTSDSAETRIMFHSIQLYGKCGMV